MNSRKSLRLGLSKLLSSDGDGFSRSVTVTIDLRPETTVRPGRIKTPSPVWIPHSLVRLILNHKALLGYLPERPE
jgi:hypothetical protein